ncbi:non-ribosomal peptide synthetase, partial [Xanthomonas albilineans]
MRDLDVLPEAERQQVLTQWNATAVDYPRDACVHELFESQVARTPSAIALVQGEVSLTYGELNARANRLAHYLCALGVRPDDRVAICLERGIAAIVAMLGVLKAGAAYLSLDPALPDRRLHDLLDDCRACAVVVDQTLPAALRDGLTQPTIALAELAITPESARNPEIAGLGPQHLAYVMYTSGSTGRPKAVMIPHQGLVGYTAALTERCALQAGDISLVFTSLHFDLALTGVYPPLLCGATVQLCAHDSTPAQWAHALRQGRGIAPLKLTPSHLALLQQELGDTPLDGCVRVLVLGGEALSADAVRWWRARSPSTQIFNHYGPTETTVGCLMHGLGEDEERIPLGRPLTGVRVYVLDAHAQLCPHGVAGELYIAGAQLARGYLGRADLTAERFVPDPFAEHPGARMYRSGDLARWRVDGTLDYLGRNDNQVKLRGFRIELGEIAAALRTCTSVQDAVVLLREDTPGEPRLVAYVISDADAHNAQSLRSQLANRLPEVMLPNAYVYLETFPLTPNGKLDRKALPAPDADALATQAYLAPEGERETQLADLYRELLGVEQVGGHDNFFALGGHSLLGVRLISRIRSTLGLELPLATLFAQPRLADLAQALDNVATSTLPAIVQTERNAPLPLSFAQQRLWFLQQLDERAGLAYLMPGGVDLHGVLNLSALQQALDRIVARHEALRTCFVASDDGATQVIAPANVGFALECIDLRQTADPDADAQLHAEQETNTPFELSRAPLIRGRLLQLAEQQHRLLVTMHHIVSDGWSMALLVQELSALYAAFVQGQPDPLPPLPIQYPDYAVWQRRWLDGPLLQHQLGFWREHLHRAPALLELPTDHPRPAVQDYRGGHVDITLDTELTDALNHLSQRHGTTVFMTVLAGWAVLLSRLSGQDQVVIGTPVANRTRSELEALIGFFVNAQALRIDLRGAPTVADLLAQVRSTALAAQDHQDVPFEQVIEALNPERSLSAHPVFQVMLTWQNVPEAELVLPDIRLQPIPAQASDAKFDLEFSLHEQQDRIVGSLGYAKALFEHSTIERHLAQFATLLRGMVANDHARVAQLPLLPPDERAQLRRFTLTETAPLTPATCVHTLFEAQVQRTPDAIAVREGQRTLRYAELDARANRLAQRLRRSGVGLESRVALYLPRSIEQVVAVLATLKAGAAYVPLDPELPSERMAFLLEDSRPRAVLTCSDLHTQLQANPGLHTASVLTMDDIADTQHDDPGAPDVPGLCPDNLAYVIYTSGSTGQP